MIGRRIWTTRFELENKYGGHELLLHMDLHLDATPQVQTPAKGSYNYLQKIPTADLHETYRTRRA